MQPDNTYTSLTERDFLDEIYYELKKISEEKYTETYKKFFTFYDYQVQPMRENEHMAIAKKFERIGVIYDVGIFYKYPDKSEFSVYLIPKDFIDFYHEKYKTTNVDPKINKKNKQSKKSKDIEITSIEILKDETERNKVTIYININYAHPREYRKGKYWGSMYELARSEGISYHRGFFNYFNSNDNNPLYAGEGFKRTKILKQEDKYIVPNIKIELVTQKAVKQRQLKSA